MSILEAPVWALDLVDFGADLGRRYDVGLSTVVVPVEKLAAAPSVRLEPRDHRVPKPYVALEVAVHKEDRFVSRRFGLRGRRPKRP